MNDEKIIELFQKRDEQAIKECMSLYGSYCRSVAAGILTDLNDVEEAVADTWLAVWDSIPPHVPKYLRLFLGRITRNQAISIWRRNNARSRGSGQIVLALEELGECASSNDTPETTVGAKELERKITAFLKNEPAVRRKVFLRRYFYLEDIAVIAHRYDLTESNVRMMLSRTRQKLKKYLTQEGYII